MKRAVVFVAACLTVLLQSSVASADPPGAVKPTSDGDNKRSSECVKLAQEAELAEWFCVGGNVFDAKTGEQRSQVPVQRHREAPDVAPSVDDWDYWCEDQIICDRQINDYIMETKANYEWGVIDGNGNYTLMGLYDGILRINLNGRQARFQQTFIWDGGPPIYFPRVWTACFEEIGGWPDLSCGEHDSGLGAYIHSGSWRWDSSLIPGSYLRNSNEYYLEFHADVRPEGYNTHPLPAFESPLFNCYGTPDDICYFP
jgi:hypothetical protein